MTLLRNAIADWLAEELDKSGEADPEAIVRRVLVDVDVAGQIETVSISQHEGKLRVAATDGTGMSAAVRSALALFEPGEEPSGVVAHSDKSKRKGRQRRSSHDLRDAIRGSSAEAPLDTFLAQVVLALVRSGVEDARTNATVAEAIARLRDAYGEQMPLAVRRWIGRLRRGISEGDLFLIARLLEGAARAADDMRTKEPNALEQERIELWQRTRDGMLARDRITDRVFIEIGRELVAGLSRASIERRYLMCIHTGEIYVEASARGDAQGSVGPSPRRVAVGLAELSGGPHPRRVRMLQYAVSNRVSPAEWQEVSERAVQRFESLHDSYRSAHQRYPGLVEPFFVIAPIRVDTLGGVVFVDADGFALPMAQARTPARAEALKSALDNGELQWVSGRAVDADGSLMLDPCALGYLRGGELRVFRVT